MRIRDLMPWIGMMVEASMSISGLRGKLGIPYRF